MKSRSLRSSRSAPDRIWITFFDDTKGSHPLVLPSSRLWKVGLVMGVFFAIMGSIAVMQISKMSGQKVDDVFGLSAFLFQAFWVLGWSVGVFILGALSFLLLFHKETARLQGGRLFRVFHLGPLRIRCEHDLVRIKNVRVEKISETGPDLVELRFDYGDGTEKIGDTMSRPHGELLATMLNEAIEERGNEPLAPPPRSILGFDLLKWLPEPLTDPVDKTIAAAIVAAEKRRRLDSAPDAATTTSEPTWTSTSSLALIAANLVPVGGVLLLGWDLAEIMLLFWIESAVIGFYNILKLVVVGKWISILVAPFFLGHYGGFMAAHFLFVYYFFVRGLDARAAEGPLLDTLTNLFTPLWFAIVSLFVSHGTSFVTNFLGQKEYADTTVEKLMSDPYQRIVVMHLTIIFGGWLTMLFHNPTPALVMLIALKTAADLHAHQKQHAPFQLRLK